MGDGDNLNKVTKIDIFGSCVTRDVLAIGCTKKLNLGEYIARQSIATVFCPPLFYDDDEIKINSNFQRRMLKNDFEKTTLDKLKLSNGEYIVVDFIDERFHIVEIQNTYLTHSSELAISEYLVGKKHRIIDKRIWFNRSIVLNLNEKIARFANELEKIYGIGRIIIHRAMLRNEYLDKKRKIQKFSKPYLEDNKKTNELLDHMYNELRKRLSKPYIIDIADSYYADETNKWGLSTMHYQKEYYLEISRKLEEII